MTEIATRLYKAPGQGPERCLAMQAVLDMQDRWLARSTGDLEDIHAMYFEAGWRSAAMLRI